MFSAAECHRCWTAAYSPTVMQSQFCRQWTICASQTHSVTWRCLSMVASFQSTVLC